MSRVHRDFVTHLGHRPHLSFRILSFRKRVTYLSLQFQYNNILLGFHIDLLNLFGWNFHLFVLMNMQEVCIQGILGGADCPSTCTIGRWEIESTVFIITTLSVYTRKAINKLTPQLFFSPEMFGITLR